MILLNKLNKTRQLNFFFYFYFFYFFPSFLFLSIFYVYMETLFVMTDLPPHPSPYSILNIYPSMYAYIA